MKKLIFMLLALAMVFSLCACGGNPETPTDPATEPPAQEERCTHNFKSTVTTEATCEEVGEITYECTLCGIIYAEETEIIDHVYIEASCDDPLFCTFCGSIWGDALGHDFTDATCTLASVCTRCGQQQSAALGHNYEEGVCLNCGEDQPEE